MRPLLLFLAVLPAFCQSPEFEVASIKPAQPDNVNSSGISTANHHLSAKNVTLRCSIRSAYNLPETRILGGPNWVDVDRYDIEAKPSAAGGDMDKMLQTLLAERFKLAVHMETRTLSGYALVVAKGGPKMQRSDPGAPSSTNSRRGFMDARGCPMEQLALRLADLVHLPVADFTRLEGRFDFKLEYTPEETQAKAAAPDAPPSIFIALQEQLGLKLEARKVPTEVLVIDRAEKPTEN